MFKKLRRRLRRSKTTKVLLPEVAATPLSASPPSDPVANVIAELVAHGIRVAEDEKGIRESASTLERFTVLSDGRIELLWRPPYDPVHNLADQELEHKIHAAKAEIAELTDLLQHARAAHTSAAAAIPALEPAPRPSLPVLAASTVSFATGFAASIITLPFISVLEPADALAVAGVIGAAMAALCVASSFSLQVREKTEVAAWSSRLESDVLGTSGGAVLIVGFALLRGAVATTPRDAVTTLALACMEAAFFLYLKSESRRYRALDIGWRQRGAGRPQALLHHEQCESAFAKIPPRIKAAEAKLETHLSERDLRHRLSFDKPMVKQAALSEMQAAYASTIAHQRATCLTPTQNLRIVA